MTGPSSPRRRHGKPRRACEQQDPGRRCGQPPGSVRRSGASRSRGDGGARPIKVPLHPLEIRLEIGGALVPQRGFLLECLLDDSVEFRWHARVDRARCGWRQAHNGRERFRARPLCERTPARRHLVQDRSPARTGRSGGPVPRPGPVRATCREWSRLSTTSAVRMRRVPPQRQQEGDAEVHQLDASRSGDEDVGRLEMRDARFARHARRSRASAIWVSISITRRGSGDVRRWSAPALRHRASPWPGSTRPRARQSRRWCRYSGGSGWRGCAPRVRNRAPSVLPGEKNLRTSSRPSDEILGSVDDAAGALAELFGHSVMGDRLSCHALLIGWLARVPAARYGGEDATWAAAALPVTTGWAQFGGGSSDRSDRRVRTCSSATPLEDWQQQ